MANDGLYLNLTDNNIFSKKIGKDPIGYEIYCIQTQANLQQTIFYIDDLIIHGAF